MTQSDKLSRVIQLIDQANAEDPHTENVDGIEHPKEQLYSQRMSERLKKFYPNAPETLQIASHAQHIQRWKSPRDSYPMNRTGYLQWRRELGKFHAKITVELMDEAGYESADQDVVTALLTKQRIKQNPLAQALEDVICLVFIEHYLEDFANKHSEEKLIHIIQKTWAKMSTEGQQAALQLSVKEELVTFIGKALNTAD
ncbi:MAG: DUF4202 domain-containing protein [Cellvibrionaceae bacterium]